jgi:hypothetical protein
MSKEAIRISARTLLQGGIDSFDRSDVQEAKVCFTLAEKLFLDCEDHWFAHIARGWKDATPTSSGSRTLQLVGVKP